MEVKLIFTFRGIVYLIPLIAGTFGRMFVIVRLRRHVRQAAQVAALIGGSLVVIFVIQEARSRIIRRS